MKKQYWFIVLLAFLFPFRLAFGLGLASLYLAELPVSSQSVEARTEAMQQGFAQVLVKVSGDPLILDNPDIKATLNKADYYVQEYSYSLPAESSSQYLIQIRYSAADVNRLLKKAGVTYWQESRPLILVWVVTSNGPHDLNILSSEMDNNFVSLMKRQSQRRGLPIIFPLMDMADVSEVSPTDVQAMKLSVLKVAGQRYAPEALLIGEVEKSDIGYQSKWRFIMGENRTDWAVTEPTMSGLVDAVLDQIRQSLVKRYAIKYLRGPELWLKLEVSHVAERDDLNQLMQYLKQISSVQQVQLSQVTGDSVELAVLVQGNLTSFQQNVLIGKRLVFKAMDEKNNTLVYEWVR